MITIEEVLLAVIAAAKYEVGSVFDETYTNIEEAIANNGRVLMYAIKDIDIDQYQQGGCQLMRTRIVISMYMRRDNCMSACNIPEGSPNWGQAMAKAERLLWWDMVQFVNSIYRKLTEWDYATADGAISIMQYAGVKKDEQNTAIELEKLGGAFGNTSMQLLGMKASFSVLWNGLADNVLFDNELLSISNQAPANA